jgi:hypothetical protein
MFDQNVLAFCGLVWEKKLRHVWVVLYWKTSTCWHSCMLCFSPSQDYTASEDIMDISSYAPPMTTSHPMSTHQSAIPTSVITPTSLTSGWLPHLNNNIHGGNFVPPSVSSSHGPITGRHQGSRAVHHGRVRSNDLDLLRMSPSTSRRRIRDEDVSTLLKMYLERISSILLLLFIIIPVSQSISLFSNSNYNTN